MTELGINPDDIVLEEIAVGRDLLLVISGGERHIGAASTAYFEDGSVQVSTSAVPHHKEHTLTASIAERAACKLHCTVTVVMGIHYDHLSREGILEVVRVVEEKVHRYLSHKK